MLCIEIGISQFLREIMARVILLSTAREDFIEINQSETRIACDGHVC